MALTDLQKKVMQRLAKNRSESSYLAGGLILNLNWPRRSDDIDIFHDTDEEVSETAEKDIADLEKEGFGVTIDVKTYGTYEATVADESSSTVIQWMSDTRIRFFPLVKDAQWGLRLHQADLAVNKILAASSRRKARDFADLVAISANMCSLGPLIMAAAGKPPAYSPQKIIEQIRWHAQTIPAEEYAAIKGLPADWTSEFIRAEVTRQMDLAETYIMSAPVEVVGVLSVNADGTPIEVTNETVKAAILRKATEEPEVMPVPVDFGAAPWTA
jgi:hypothetical protein